MLHQEKNLRFYEKREQTQLSGWEISLFFQPNKIDIRDEIMTCLPVLLKISHLVFPHSNQKILIKTR